MEMQLPPAVAPGDRVAVVAPSSGGAHEHPHVFELALERLKTVFSLEPVVFPTARQGTEFLSRNPRARAADIHAAFSDPDISAVFATIGGWDQLRICAHLDHELLAANPTRFFGMSDNTNLSLELFAAGVISFNGGQLLNEIAVPGALPAYTERYCRRAIFDSSLGTIAPSTEWTDEPSDWEDPAALETAPTYRSNDGWQWAGATERVSGPLWGGNQSIVKWRLAADRCVPEPETVDGAILALETAEDLPSPTTVRATLLSIGERGLLEQFGGVIVGRIRGQSFLEQPPAAQQRAYRRQVRTAIIEEVKRYNPSAPVVCGLDWGHTTPVAPLPIGAPVTIDAIAETITVESPS